MQILCPTKQEVAQKEILFQTRDESIFCKFETTLARRLPRKNEGKKQDLHEEDLRQNLYGLEMIG